MGVSEGEQVLGGLGASCLPTQEVPSFTAERKKCQPHPPASMTGWTAPWRFPQSHAAPREGRGGDSEGIG